ncbi:hypothetical protein NESM_000465000 [Novymonas esmeraldas]|uniref:Uncharacterized protein n=1 Tax=Novymonas esmeraldas TaxID=1808958 RepID=A0AAW0EPI5_9TRYP
MKLHLEEAYEELCAEYNTKPLWSFLSCLRNTYATADGEVFIDASSVEGEHFCVFVELLRQLLRRPNMFIQPAIVRLGTPSAPLTRSPLSTAEEQDSHVFYAVPPRLLRLKLRLSRNANNTDVERVSRLIVVEKVVDCVPFPIPGDDGAKAGGQATGSLSQLNWPEKAVVECIDLHDCVFVSLTGGRALRAAARRNAYLQHVFLEGCSVNAAVVAHIVQVTRGNREQFRHACAVA